MEETDFFRLTTSSKLGRRPRTSIIRTNKDTDKKKKTMHNTKGLQNTIHELTQKNRRLRNVINHLRDSEESNKARKLLYQDFELDLSDMLKSLEKRNTALEDISKRVNSFSSPSRNFKTLDPNKITRACEDESRNRAFLDLEYKQLQQKALFNERQLTVLKMQLKLQHDKRDFSLLRRSLNGFEGGGVTLVEDSSIENDLKIQIKNIQLKCNYEKERIERQKSPIALQHDSATTIQSAWRGYLLRHRLKLEKQAAEILAKRAQEGQDNQPIEQNGSNPEAHEEKPQKEVVEHTE